MGNALCGVVLTMLVGSSLPAQDGLDFSGRWVLESPSPPAPDTPKALSVRQSVASANVRGEPMRPSFKSITIDREFESGARSETQQIGVRGGVVPGLGADGKPNGRRQHHAVRWDANTLVFESGSYAGQSPEAGVWTERSESWSLDSDGRLHVAITTRSSADAASTVALVYARQESLRIASLTVPARLLPAGCRLAPDAASGDPSFQMFPSLRQNPWVGSGLTAVSIRGVVDGPISTDGVTGPERMTKLESGIVEAYRARYLAADRSAVEVYGVHFDDPALTAAAPLNRLRNRPGRTIVLGATAVWVSPGKGGDCFRAVADYIASLR